MGMTLDEAIKHAEEVGNGCDECATEHRQLAEWLRKYQKIEQIIDDWNNEKINHIICCLEIEEVVNNGKID